MNIIGVDESGRGSIAGCIVGVAYLRTGKMVVGVKDSKKLSESKREKIYGQIIQEGKYKVSLIQAWDIDKMGINQANQSVLRDSTKALLQAYPESRVLVDGKFRIGGVPSEAIIGGDDKVYEISCASIIAKVVHDEYMVLVEKLEPHLSRWGLTSHKGYGTKEHYAAIKLHGLSHEHRKTFLS